MYRRKDAYYARAKAVGYRSRAAFKLLQLTEHTRLIRAGDCVVDVGAWPGGWLQVAAQQAGAAGKVIGVDLQPIEPVPERTVMTIAGDITDPATRRRVAEACGGKADVLLSDLSPKLTGVRARDEAQAQMLADALLDFAGEILKPGGHVLVKLFMSGGASEYLACLRARFHNVRLTRPPATRKGSAELYAIATGFRGNCEDRLGALLHAPRR